MDIIESALAFYAVADEAESENRGSAKEDIEFSHGDQWDTVSTQARGKDRPCLTINKLDAHIRQVCNMQRQQRPRIKAHGVNSDSDKRTAEVFTGICRHIEVNSGADNAYDIAFEASVRGGWGYWRVLTDYVREDSFEQEIFIKPIENPFSVYFDPNSIEPDGSDAEKCLITEMMSKETFRAYYPDKNDGADFQAGENNAAWVMKDQIRVAEFFWVERKRDKLCLLSNGKTAWQEEVKEAGKKLTRAGITVISERHSWRRTVKWAKITALEVLEERDWPGQYIPVVPVFGNIELVDGKRKKFGMVRHARDPQKAYNFWRTAMTETVAMAPKAKWLVPAGGDDGYEEEWRSANTSPRAVLHYNTEEDGKEIPKPERIQPEPPPSGLIQSAVAVAEDLSSVLGIVDPAERKGGNLSGKALRGEKQQSDNSTFHYFDNLTRSIRWTGKIILDLIPRVYVEPDRIIRIIGSDEQPKLVTLNEQAADKILNDVTVGLYDVVMDTGPGYDTKRQEALESFTQLMTGPLGAEVARVGGDLAVRLLDAPGMDTLADRLAAANPLANIDENSDVPPKAQMQIQQLQAQLQQAMQVIQQQGTEIKFKQGIEQMRQAGETQREHMRMATKAHDTQVVADTKQQDTHTRALTAQNVEEIRAMAQIILHKLGEAESLRADDDPEKSLGEAL